MYGVTETAVDATEYPPFTVYSLNTTLYPFTVYGSDAVPFPDVSLNVPDKFVHEPPLFVLYCICVMDPEPRVAPLVNVIDAVFNPGVATIEVGAEGTPYGVAETVLDATEYPPFTVYCRNLIE